MSGVRLGRPVWAIALAFAGCLSSNIPTEHDNDVVPNCVPTGFYDVVSNSSSCGDQPFHDPAYACVSDEATRCEIELTWELDEGCAVTEVVRVDAGGNAEIAFTLDRPVNCGSNARGHLLGSAAFSHRESEHDVRFAVPSWVGITHGCDRGPFRFTLTPTDRPKPEDRPAWTPPAPADTSVPPVVTKTAETSQTATTATTGQTADTGPHSGTADTGS